MEIKKIKKLIKNSEIVLIGIGSKTYRDDELPENHLEWSDIKKYNNVKSKSLKINKKILKIFENKDYFIITTSCADNLSDNIPLDRLFNPNGSCSKLQCYNSCTNELFDYSNYTRKRINPLCPNCGAPLIMNIPTDAFFVNENILLQESNYYTWIHKNYNNEILLIELETNKNDDRLINKPFENIATALPNATLLKVNSNNIEIPENVPRQESLRILPEEFFKLF